MFKIKQGFLRLDHPEVKKFIFTTMMAELQQMKPNKILKLIYFLKNYKHIENPVTVLTYGTTILEIHPGHFRLITAKLLNKPHINSIVLYNYKQYLIDIGYNWKELEDICLMKQATTDWYQISTTNQKKYIETKQNLDSSYEIYHDFYKKKYLQKYGNLCWFMDNTLIYTTNMKADKITRFDINNHVEFFDSLRKFSIEH